MNGLFIDPVRLPIGRFEIDYKRIEENFPQEPMNKEVLILECPSNSLLEFWATIRNQISEHSLEDLRNMKLDLNDWFKKLESHYGTLNILGEYLPGKRKINYYPMNSYLIEVVKIHERFHAIHHLTTDSRNNDEIWTNFRDKSSLYKEFLAQLFTYRFCKDEESNDPRLLHTFLDLSDRQHLVYQTWQAFKDYQWPQIIELYWAIRDGLKIQFLEDLQKKISSMSSTPNPKSKNVPINLKSKPIIPITKLRGFYETLGKLRFRTETQKNMIEDLNRKENYEQLIDLYLESSNHFNNKYNNSNEPFILNPNRKIPISTTSVSRTIDIISILETQNPLNIVVNHSNYDFEYINREVSTYRTTNAEFEDGRQGKSSGQGGLDFIAWNNKKEIPILGEIKIGSDQNPFYALIQLLTYLSEMSTPNQINRINNTHLFGSNILSANVKFDLYLLFCHTKKIKSDFHDILNKTKDLGDKIVNSGKIDRLGEIVFLEMDPISNDITLI